MKNIIITAVAVLAPAVVFAQRAVDDVNSLAEKLTGIGNTVIGILISLAVVWIVWNAVLFVIHAADDDRKKYQGAIMWGIVGLFVIVSLWGLVAILSNTFGTYNEDHAGKFSPDVDSLILK